MKTQSTVIVGNALAGMVAALELAKKGQKVTLINPAGPLGGYFGGLQSGGVMFDGGLVKFELDSYFGQVKRSDLASYQPRVRNDIGRFLSIVHEWAKEYGEIIELDMPKMMFEGKIYDDAILSNAYHSFSQLPFAKESLQELENLQVDANKHARNKATGELFNTLDYASASIANHGKTMHEKLIAPYLEKVMGIDASGILARYHRVGWMPLYYPETLKDCFAGKPSPLAPTTFHYVKSSNVANLLGKVKEEFLNHPNISYVAEPVTKVTKVGAGWELARKDFKGSFDNLVWTYQPTHLLKALGLPIANVKENKAFLALLMLRVKRSDVKSVYSFLNLLDLDCAFYRATNQSACAADEGDVMNITLEFNLDYFRKLYGENERDDVVIEKLVGELVKKQLLAENTVPVHAEVKRIPGGFLIPNAAARDAWEEDHATIANAYPEIGLLAMSSGFFATSLNDQVIQGLHYAIDK